MGSIDASVLANVGDMPVLSGCHPKIGVVPFLWHSNYVPWFAVKVDTGIGRSQKWGVICIFAGVGRSPQYLRKGRVSKKIWKQDSCIIN